VIVALLAAAALPAKPPIEHNPIPFGAKRKAEMRRYAERHYGLNTDQLRDPKVIVIHYTDNDSFASTFNTFAPDHPDPELHELPNVCSHFVIDQSGTIHQLVPLGLMCRHTVGLNWTAFGIEHVGRSDAQVLHNHAQLHGRYGIETKNVIGHNESRTSPFHRERVKALQNQTHGDFVKRDMDVYRAKLLRLGG
jgi:N-acetylmuramoyl-L-alanine amidase